MQSSPVGVTNSQQPTPVRLAAPGQAQAFEPGGVGVRFVARFIDGIILGVIRFPVAIVVQLVSRSFIGNVNSPDQLMQGQGGMVLIMLTLFNLVFGMAVFLAYNGWFYRNKGATPGKLLMGLRVVDATTGTYLSWGQTFMREIVGWFVDGLTLFIGLLMAAFRSDKRALHDLIGGTQVLRVKK
jgi:uncharacterized RDD family membrane protein YckC